MEILRPYCIDCESFVDNYSLECNPHNIDFVFYVECHNGQVLTKTLSENEGLYLLVRDYRLTLSMDWEKIYFPRELPPIATCKYLIEINRKVPEYHRRKYDKDRDANF